MDRAYIFILIHFHTKYIKEKNKHLLVLLASTVCSTIWKKKKDPLSSNQAIKAGIHLRQLDQVPENNQKTDVTVRSVSLSASRVQRAWEALKELLKV